MREFVRELEVCVMDRSLCMETEFATAAFQNNSLSNETRKQILTEEIVQYLQSHTYANTTTFKAVPWSIAIDENKKN